MQIGRIGLVPVVNAAGYRPKRSAPYLVKQIGIEDTWCQARGVAAHHITAVATVRISA
jgi:hypothetical protein